MARFNWAIKNPNFDFVGRRWYAFSVDGLLLVVALISELQQLALSQMRAYTGEQIVMRLRTRLFGHLQRLSLSYHDARGTDHAE